MDTSPRYSRVDCFKLPLASGDYAMPNHKNLWDIPEWHAIGREAALVRHLVGSGVTALGRANYADQGSGTI